MPYLNDAKSKIILPVDWDRKCDESYRQAWERLKDEIEGCRYPQLKVALNARLDSLSNEKTKEIVCTIGDVFNAGNFAFVSTLKSVLEQPQQGIPQELQNYIVVAIENRQKESPHEISDMMHDNLALFYAEVIEQFSQGSPSSNALPYTEAYMEEFLDRSAEAREHVAKCKPEIAASADRAVHWCYKLTGFTSAEADLDKTRAGLLEILNSFSYRYGDNGCASWPNTRVSEKLEKKAIEIVRTTATYIGGGMLFIDPAQPGFTGQTSEIRSTIIGNIDEYIAQRNMIDSNPRQLNIALYQRAQL